MIIRQKKTLWDTKSFLIEMKLGEIIWVEVLRQLHE